MQRRANTCTQISVCLIIFASVLQNVHLHLIGDKAHLSELKKLCEHAYTCFHDNVITCGKSVNEARTFLDLCDLYEYSCEYNMDMSKKKKESAQIQENWDKGLGSNFLSPYFISESC